MIRSIRKQNRVPSSRALALATLTASAAFAGGVVIPAGAALAAPMPDSAVVASAPGKGHHHKHLCTDKKWHKKHYKDSKYSCWYQNKQFFWDKQHKVFFVEKDNKPRFFAPSVNNINFFQNVSITNNQTNNITNNGTINGGININNGNQFKDEKGIEKLADQKKKDEEQKKADEQKKQQEEEQKKADEQKKQQEEEQKKADEQKKQQEEEQK
ncbi:hypothetical protein ACGFZB_16925, partial [Streptomyces cinerochromogenes]